MTADPPSAPGPIRGRSGAATLAAGRSIARNAFHLVAGQVVLTAISFVLGGYLGRSLGAEEFGLYFFIVSTGNFAYTFVDWGQMHVLVREVARRREQAGALLGGALAIRLTGGAIAALLTFPVLRAAGYEARTAALASLFMIVWIPSALWMAYGMAFRAREAMGDDAKVSVSNKALTLVLVVPALALGGGLPAVIACMGLAGVGALAHAAVIARRSRFPALRLSSGTVRELLSSGAPLLVMNLLMIAQNYMEPLVLSLVAPAEVLGWYGAARTIANALVMPGSIVASASFPRISRASRIPGALAQEFDVTFRPVVILSILVGAGTWAFGPFAVSLVYGVEGFRGAGTILQFIGPTLSLMFLNLVLANTALVAGRTRASAILKGLALAVSGGLAVWLVPLTQRELGNGAVGLIVSFGVSEALMLVGMVRLVPPGLLTARSASTLLRALAAGLLGLLATRAIPWPHPAAEFPAFLLTFVGSGLLLGLLSPADFAALPRAVRRGG